MNSSSNRCSYSKDTFGSGMTTLIISKEETNIMNKTKSLKDTGLLIKGVSETIENEAKEKKGGVLSMVLGKLGASLLENLQTGKGVKRSKIPGRGVMGADEGTLKANQYF